MSPEMGPSTVSPGGKTQGAKSPSQWLPGKLMATSPPGAALARPFLGLGLLPSAPDPSLHTDQICCRPPFPCVRDAGVCSGQSLDAPTVGWSC